MNPVLLKPESETGSQIILQGRVAGHLSSGDYARRGDFMPQVLESFARLGAGADLVIVEGAGSPAETNLRARDIANLGFARAAGVPGGPDRRHRPRRRHRQPRRHPCGAGRGRPRHDRAASPSTASAATSRCSPPASRRSAARTGWPCLGVVPWFAEAARLPAEDGLDLRSRRAQARRRAQDRRAGPARHRQFRRSRPAEARAGGRSRPGAARRRPLPGDADLVILPGSKTTLRDLAVLRARGLGHRHRRPSSPRRPCAGPVRRLPDAGPGRARSARARRPGRRGAGLGLLDVETVLDRDKTVREVEFRHAASAAGGQAYEIHLGRSEGEDRARAPFRVDDQAEGAASPDGRVVGTYLHGVFAVDAVRAAYLAGARRRVPPSLAYEARGRGDARPAGRASGAASRRRGVLALARAGCGSIDANDDEAGGGGHG